MKRFGSAAWNGGLREGKGSVSTESRALETRCVSFAATRVSIVGWIYDPDHSLPPGMYVDVPDFARLLVAPPITVEGLDHVILKPKKFDRVVAVNVDEVLRHLLLA